MKLLFFSFFGLITFFGYSQSNIQYRPLKEEVYYRSQDDLGWEIFTTTLNTYSQSGDRVTRMVLDKDLNPISKDSVIYNPSNEILEIHKFQWSLKEGKLMPYDKIINCFTQDGRSCGSLVYHFNNSWTLISGTETTYESNSEGQEIIITRTFSELENKWKNVTKEIHQFNEIGEKDWKLIYSADQVSNEFVEFYKHTYSGWHDFEKGIYKQATSEKFIKGSWVVDVKNSIVRKNNFWEEIEERVFQGGVKYKTLFDDNNSYREVSVSNAGGWKLVSEFAREHNTDVIVHFEYNGGDIVTRINRKEIEKNNEGRVIRHLQKVYTPEGTIEDFSEVLHDLIYTDENQLAEDIRKIREVEQGNYKPAIRTVYSQYVKVGEVTAINDYSKRHVEEIEIYPNPVSDSFTVNSKGVLVKEINLFDSYGNISGNWIGEVKYADVTDKTPGMYLIEVVFDDESKKYSRIIIK